MIIIYQEEEVVVIDNNNVLPGLRALGELLCLSLQVGRQT